MCAPNDVWSLGVILVNLTCRRNPWKLASPEDASYRAFIYNPEFLKTILPISDELNRILGRIFTHDPAKRITLAQLRREILACPRFTNTPSRQPLESTMPVFPGEDVANVYTQHIVELCSKEASQFEEDAMDDTDSVSQMAVFDHASTGPYPSTLDGSDDSDASDISDTFSDRSSNSSSSMDGIDSEARNQFCMDTSTQAPCAGLGFRAFEENPALAFPPSPEGFFSQPHVTSLRQTVAPPSPPESPRTIVPAPAVQRPSGQVSSHTSLGGKPSPPPRISPQRPSQHSQVPSALHYPRYQGICEQVRTLPLLWKTFNQQAPTFHTTYFCHQL